MTTDVQTHGSSEMSIDQARHDKRRRRSLLAAVGIGCALLVPGTAAAPAAAASGPYVTGSGTGFLIVPPFTGDPVRVQIAAVERGDGLVGGHFDILHSRPSGELEAHISGDITCLRVSGRTATLTGEVTQGVTPVKPGFTPVGHVVALTVVDGGSLEQMGLDLDWFPVDHRIGPCAAALPQVHVSEGRFEVQG